MLNLLMMLISAVSFAAPAVSPMEAPECEGRPEFITEIRTDIIGGFEKLPAVLLVAREAEFYVESKEQGEVIKIHSYQSFKKGGPEKPKILCGTPAKTANSNRFSMFAPTLIDTTPKKAIGQSLWQFQMISIPSGFSVWNQRSLASVEQQSLEKNLMDFGGSYRLYQLNPREYEIVVSKTSETKSQYLSIKFDAISPF